MDNLNTDTPVENNVVGFISLNGNRISSTEEAGSFRMLEQQALGIAKCLKLTFGPITVSEYGGGVHSKWEGPAFRSSGRDSLYLLTARPEFMEMRQLVLKAIEQPGTLNLQVLQRYTNQPTLLTPFERYCYTRTPCDWDLAIMDGFSASEDTAIAVTRDLTRAIATLGKKVEVEYEPGLFTLKKTNAS